MKKIFFYILSVILNIGLYFLLQIIASFVQFGLFGSGNVTANKTVLVSLVFLILQVLLLLFLYKKKILLKDITLLILNVLITVCLFLYFVVYLANN
ncbi:Uncharacterised protein [Sphingobacterium spiritivorum]|uniref:Uncharacterized protein n=1 Tax=Sphingobacterium spiritivorum ATCC 33861 TaxID=525373 RepID=D7VTZ3_SPHSI|nr:hypothetical protein HMPREF0766_14463 [Sphingobacterium spiritivorum ATCC 33861]SUI98671.1 Uncharacterised protein [Sphingobacterium spiritivorum]